MARLLATIVFCILLASCSAVRMYTSVRSAMRQNELRHPEVVEEIPFHYKDDWVHFRMSVQQNENVFEGDFLFDTGAFTGLFDSSGSLVVSKSDAMEVPFTGAFGTATKELRIAENVLLKLRSLEIEKRKVLVSKRSALIPDGTIGIVGADFFRGCIVQIDFIDSCLRIIPRSSFTPLSAPMNIDCIGQYNPVLRGLLIGGIPSQDYLLDLGQQGSVLVQAKDSSALRKKIGDSALIYASEAPPLHDASGKQPKSNYYVRYDSGFNFEQSAPFEVLGLVNADNPKKFSNLGLEFMRQVFSSITFDLPQRKFYYQLRTEYKPVERIKRDIYFDIGDSTFLTGPVSTISTWYHQGVRPGQKVLLINGESPLRFREARKAGRDIPVHSLTIQTGEGEQTLSRNQ